MSVTALKTAPRPLNRDELIAMSGIEAMQALVEGRIAAPSIAETLGFSLVEVGEGFAAFEGDPSDRILNPMGTVHGGWALIRMQDRDARPGRKVRHNWLLIKEKDEAAQPGEPDALSAYDTSVTTGRTLAEIAGAKKKNVWNSNKGLAADKRRARTGEPASKSVLAKKKNPKAKPSRRKK